jgi:hypothetical protein
MTDINRHCRIGKIKFHSGAEMRIIPSFIEGRAEHALEDLMDAVRIVRSRYRSDLAGFILIPFNQNLTHDVHLRIFQGTYLNMASVPVWAQEVLRMHVSRRTTREMLGMDCDDY